MRFLAYLLFLVVWVVGVVLFVWGAVELILFLSRH